MRGRFDNKKCKFILNSTMHVGKVTINHLNNHTKTIDTLISKLFEVPLRNRTT